MGLFSSNAGNSHKRSRTRMTSRQRSLWEAHCDNYRGPTKRTPGGTLYQDDKGDWYLRNGHGCCGCGKHVQAGNAHIDDWTRPPQLNVKGW